MLKSWCKDIPIVSSQFHKTLMKGLHKSLELKISESCKNLSVFNIAFSVLISVKTDLNQLFLNINPRFFIKEKSNQSSTKNTYVFLI